MEPMTCTFADRKISSFFFFYVPSSLRDSNPSLEAQIPTLRLKSLPHGPEFSLEAQISSQCPTSTHKALIPSIRPF